MAKHNKPSHPSAEEPKQEDFSTAHPLMRNKSQAQDMLEKAMSRKDENDFKIQEVAQWKQCVNAVAASDNGKMLLRSMIQFAGIMEPPVLNNPNRMVTNTIKGSFYLTWIRPYLEASVRRELE